jgi:hypothetical protein
MGISLPITCITASIAFLENIYDKRFELAVLAIMLRTLKFFRVFSTLILVVLAIMLLMFFRVFPILILVVLAIILLILRFRLKE